MYTVLEFSRGIGPVWFADVEEGLFAAVCFGTPLACMCEEERVRMTEKASLVTKHGILSEKR